MFCSRDEKYRNPTGAVKAGENIHFRISLPRDLSCSAISLIMEHEGHETRVHNMFWCGMNGEYEEWWECDFAPQSTGLHFYYFELRTNHGTRKLTKGEGGHAVANGMEKWQLTVYSPKYQRPDWLDGGIIYQIFPDRFHSSCSPKTEQPAYRIMHDSWNEEIVWQANENGVIDNKDFFGGDLAGISEKLSYLHDLGVTCIYLNPIFMAYSNHRYDTADYSVIDPTLGNEADFRTLCEKAEGFGIRVIIDGVFSHTGSYSIYFNKDGHFNSVGAYNSKESEFYPWYSFKNWPNEYDSWWGFDTLPNVNELNPAFNDYINGEAGIVKKWMKAGAAGWRLDVADELPDEFIDNITAAVKSEKPDGLVLGEVWEDASTKTAYGMRRRYLLGNQLDSVMNYPFSQAITDFLLGGAAESFFECIETIQENYPPETVRLLMNHIGTHDTQRALTLLAGEPLNNHGREWQSSHFLSPIQREIGIHKLKLASLIQYTLPGVPSVYYGDEAGMEGYKDPFNRRTFPWDSINEDLLSWYKALGKFRTEQGKRLLSFGSFKRIHATDDTLIYSRIYENDSLTVILNRGSRFQTINRDFIPEAAVNVLGVDLAKNEYELEPFGFSVYLCETASHEEKSPEEQLQSEAKPDFMKRIRALLGF